MPSATTLLVEDVQLPVPGLVIDAKYWPGMHVILKPEQSPESDKLYSLELTLSIDGVQSYATIMLANANEVHRIVALGRGTCKLHVVSAQKGDGFVIRGIDFRDGLLGRGPIQVYEPR